MLRQAIAGLISTLVFTSIVLVSAGRNLWQAWVYAGISLALNLGLRLVLRNDPELARERARRGVDARDWDKRLLGVGLLLTLAMLITAGLQHRFSPEAPSLSFVWFVVGVACNVVGMALFFWALRENHFFSAVVRIQKDRGHTVCTTGPYRWIRHPGNLGMLIGTLGFPLLFQSTWSLIPAGLSALMMVVRTRLEDDLLTNELDGYRDYREHTRFRLVPGLW